MSIGLHLLYLDALLLYFLASLLFYRHYITQHKISPIAIRTNSSNFFSLIRSGTGLTKLGFAGNDSPSFIFPTVIATRQSVGGTRTQAGAAGGHLSQRRGTEDLDFFIGNEALEAANGPRKYNFSC